ncbi:carbamoyl-phosphate synthase, large chain [Candidatus Blochmanniella pennsylvanica str. BPEN]|uniref:Carbamoyl phosphate synthase large chain n=1 Tax=Blochmanniella pennsylvanica (strain BPEN) TaxID=291272 RepID=Q494F2_BLOPB|nr:carbamoyl-phosphate synthase large subunit [Candidatus Blochmannia pennsylvanicus]AAZ40767.1 carbamoyl-phosphate synthase, large chain [Candidatus Blochmannia pennsylvanicus str. BPEN]UOY04547.1 carbamoyl-phosphate synthase large subunit [Candidatus Blochmannia pennsylvanicus]
MPKRTDIHSILLLGAGPIVIGQACEFDYSGAQACKALREEGYRIILVNSNPATIMTDPDMADVTYIEAIQWKIIHKIIEKEHPDALLSTMGGQTALNCTLDLERHGILKKFNIITIGATIDSICKAEDRQKFRESMKKISLETARSGVARDIDEAMMVLEKIGLPCIIRPSFTLGGTGGGVAYTQEEFEKLCRYRLDSYPHHELLIDESLIGWKEYEMEVIRDIKDNCIIVCSIENVDPMGIHTGDSITVAPAQTLTDKEYQIMRNASIMVLREIGVETGGANVQFAVNPNNGRLIVVEMNPRVSRSSALASKATGFPIAKIASKLAVGYALDELSNDITNGCIPASFEPSIDYVVTKIPRFNFEKFPERHNKLTTQMKSVGEVMAIGRSQQESLQKAIRGLEIGVMGLDSQIDLNHPKAFSIIVYELKNASSNRIWYIADAFRYGISLEQVFYLTNIDRWFLVQIQELVQLENDIMLEGISCLDKNRLYCLKKKGFSDARLGKLTGVSENKIRTLRFIYDIHPVYKHVDACAAEFSTNTSYMYSTYDGECEFQFNHTNKTIMILGGGPNRIGQGIEFDYCCVHAAITLRESGYHVIMVNCNPETVSTDYDISDILYFEPITLEDILEIIRINKPTGVIVQYGGQTPLKLVKEMEASGISIIGTSPDAIDQAENRERFQRSIKCLGLQQPDNATVISIQSALKKAKNIGYPIVVRPSYVLGGRAMEIVYNEKELLFYFKNAILVSNNAPVLLDSFLENAIEVDVDAICDGKQVFIGGIMEHIEYAGIHSGDSACSLPAHTLSKNIQDRIRCQVKELAFKFNIKGLVNIQFAIQKDEIYIIEINPRASRTIPFVSKATGMELAKIGTRVMIGQSLLDQGILKEVIPPYFSVKEVVLPFNKFIGMNPKLGPEMRSTGEVMGIGRTFEEAFAKATLSSQLYMKKHGDVLLSLSNKDTDKAVDLVTKFIKNGFMLDVTCETANILKSVGLVSQMIRPVHVTHPYIHKKIKNGGYSYIVDTTLTDNISNDYAALLCRIALRHNVYYITTINGSFAAAMSLAVDTTEHVVSLQDMHSKIVH